MHTVQLPITPVVWLKWLDLDPEVRERTDKLDAVGNTTAAIGKGFAIGSAALTALALFAAFMTQIKDTGVTELNVLNPEVMSGLLIGAMLPFVFSAMAMLAVGRAAGAMIEEFDDSFVKFQVSWKEQERRITDAASTSRPLHPFVKW